MSNVSLEVFLKECINDLEIENEIQPTFPLKDVPEYDSMGKITLSLTIERLFDYEIPYDVLDKLETLKLIYEHCIINTKSD